MTVHAGPNRPPALRSLGAALSLLRASCDRHVTASLLGALTLVAMSSALSAVTPLALKQIIDALDASLRHSPSATAPVWHHVTIYLLAIIAGRIAADLRPLFAGRAEQRVLATLRQRFLAHLLRLPMHYLVKRRAGEFVHAADLAAAGAQLLMSHLTGSLAPVLVELAVMVAILGRLDQPRLVALFAAASCMYLVVYALGAWRLKRAAAAVTNSSLEVHGQLNDGVANVETLRCFGAEEQVEAALLQASTDLVTRWGSFNRLMAAIALGATTIFASTLGAAVLLSAEAVAQGKMSLGSFLLVGIYIVQMVRPLEVIGGASRDLSRALGYMRPLLDLLSEPREPGVTTASQAPVERSKAPSVRLENLHFAYEPGHPVLAGLDLEIPAGATVAIVGRSGSGKSSLVRLLLRLYAPQTGRILIDGHPLEDLAATDLRAITGLVPQDTSLFHATATHNIALGLTGIVREQVERAAQSANIHHRLASLPLGYETLLGDRGQTLSGGERQRLAIARATVRRPSIYLLDEPTSMLDGKTEAEVLQSLRQLTAGCTTIVVAHRLSTVVHVDEIVVLDGGRLVERGRHAQLLADGGLYAQLWRQQTAGAS